MWGKLYKKSFKEPSSPSLGITKTRQIFICRNNKYKNLRLNCCLTPKCNEIGTSPYGKKLDNVQNILNNIRMNHELQKFIKKFSLKNKTFLQFCTTKNQQIYKSIIYNKDPFEDNIYNNFLNKDYKNVYDEYDEEGYEEKEECMNWLTIKKLDFFPKNGHFEIWVVLKSNDFIDLYVNKKCISENVSHVKSSKDFFTKEFVNMCKKVNVNWNEMIDFLLMC